MKVKITPHNKNIQNAKIKNLISFNNIKNPFKNLNESEKFFKNIIEEEMNLSNNYNSENLNKLLELYFKGLNMYQNTPNIEMINAFTEKAQMLLQSSRVKKILNQNKKKTKEIKEIKTDSTLIDENEESDYSNKNKIINKEKSEYNNLYNNEEEEDEDDENEYNTLKYDFKKNKTIRLNEIQNRNKLNYLSNSIKKGIKEKNNQKQKINEINKDINNIKEQQLKTSIFLEDEIKKQSNNFKKNLIRKKTMLYNKSKNIKFNFDVIKEENMKEDKDNNNQIKNIENKDNQKFKRNKENKENKSYRIGKIRRNKTPKKLNYKLFFNKTKDIKQLRRNSFSFFIKKDNNINKIKDDNKSKNNNDDDIDNNNIINQLKSKINKYIEEYNDDIYKYYFSSTINKISDLAKKNFSSNINIYEGYQINIKDLLKKQMSCNNAEEEGILEDDINSLREEQDHEIVKNNDLYEKLIEEEISNFKSFGYSNLTLKELDILKNTIKCDLYNEIYNILNK